MYPAIFSRTYQMTQPQQVFAAIRADGFAGVQVNLSSFGLASLPAELPEGVAEQGGKIASDHGLRIAALSGTYNMAHPDRQARLQMRPRFAKAVAAAQRMGAPVVTLCTGSRNAASMWEHHPDNASTQAWQDLVEELVFAIGVAEEFDVLLGIEPEPGNVVSGVQSARRLLDQLKSSRLKIVLDAANIIPLTRLAGQVRIMEEAVDLLGAEIVLAHAKDKSSAGEVVPPGEGAIDLVMFARKLHECGFDGALIGHGFEPASAPAAACYLNKLCGIDT